MSSFLMNMIAKHYSEFKSSQRMKYLEVIKKQPFKSFKLISLCVWLNSQEAECEVKILIQVVPTSLKGEENLGWYRHKMTAW